MPERARPLHRDCGRATDFMNPYRREAEQMHRKQSPKNHMPQPSLGNDAAVVLPILLLLMQEGADRYLLFALLYILL